MNDIKKTSTAFLSAYRKGGQSYRDGRRRVSPYADHVTGYHNGVTFSRSFQRFWYEGYDDAAGGLPERYFA